MKFGEKLIVVCGWPVCGKNTIAAEVSKQLQVHWIDIDNVRILNFGPPHPRPNESQELMRRDREEMKGSYHLLFESAACNLSLHYPLVITATFSRSVYWYSLFKSIEGYDAKLKIIWCNPKNDRDEEIERRLAKRVFGVNCWSAVNSLEHYKEVKKRFLPPQLPHLELDTSPPNTAEECVKRAVNFIRT